MRTIYQIDHGFLGETAEIAPGQPAPVGWTFTAPPKIPRGKAAKWDGEHGSGWTLVPSSEEKSAQSARETLQQADQLRERLDRVRQEARQHKDHAHQLAVRLGSIKAQHESTRQALRELGFRVDTPR